MFAIARFTVIEAWRRRLWLPAQNERGGLLTAPTESPAAVIYSTGANLRPDGANADFEGAPCGNATGYNPGGTACPDGEPLYQGGAPNNLAAAPFDDIVVWLSRPRLYYGMVTAGRLP